MNSFKNQSSSNYYSLRAPTNRSTIGQSSNYAFHDSTTIPRNFDIKYQNPYLNLKPQNTYMPRNQDQNMFSNATFGADKYDLSHSRQEGAGLGIYSKEQYSISFHTPNRAQTTHTKGQYNYKKNEAELFVSEIKKGDLVRPFGTKYVETPSCERPLRSSLKYDDVICLKDPTTPLGLKKTIEKIEDAKKRPSTTQEGAMNQLSTQESKQRESDRPQTELKPIKSDWVYKQTDRKLSNEPFQQKSLYQKLSPKSQKRRQLTANHLDNHRYQSNISNQEVSQQKDIDIEIFSVNQKLKYLENERKLLMIGQQQISLRSQLEHLKSQKDQDDYNDRFSQFESKYDYFSNMGGREQYPNVISQKSQIFKSPPLVKKSLLGVEMQQNYMTVQRTKPRKESSVEQTKSKIYFPVEKSYREKDIPIPYMVQEHKLDQIKKVIVPKVFKKTNNLAIQKPIDNSYEPHQILSVINSPIFRGEYEHNLQENTGIEINPFDSYIDDTPKQNENQINEELQAVNPPTEQIKNLKQKSLEVQNRAKQFYMQHRMINSFIKEDSPKGTYDNQKESQIDFEDIRSPQKSSHKLNQIPSTIMGPLVGSIPVGQPINNLNQSAASVINKQSLKMNSKQPRQIQKNGDQQQSIRQLDIIPPVNMNSMKRKLSNATENTNQQGVIIEMFNNNTFDANYINSSEDQQCNPSEPQLLSPVDTNDDRLIERGRSKSIVNTKTLNIYFQKVDSILDSKAELAKNKEIPSFHESVKVKKIAQIRKVKQWSEWLCDRISDCINDHSEIENKNENYIFMVKEYPFVKNKITGQYQTNPCCIAEIEFNTAVIEQEKKVGLDNLAFPEQAVIFKNDDQRKCTWLYQMNLKKKYVFKEKDACCKNPFSHGKFHFNLEKILFINKKIERKGEMVQSIQHGPFYDSLVKHCNKAAHKRNLVWQLIQKMAMVLLKYQKAGLVHGNLNLQSVELMINQFPDKADEISDLRVINQDFSYKYGKNAHTYFEIDQQFTRVNLPPEMVNNLKHYYSDNKDKMDELSKKEQPWSHDMWSFGIILLQIIAGCPVDRITDQVVITQFEKSKIARGLFSLPKNVLEDEGCDDHAKNDKEKEECPNKKKKFFMAFQSVHQVFLDNLKRKLIKCDLYNLLEDQELFDIITHMLKEEPNQRISPQELLNHDYFKNNSQ